MLDSFETILSTVVVSLAILIPVFFLRGLMMTKEQRRYQYYEKYGCQTAKPSKCEICRSEFAATSDDDRYCLNCLSVSQ